MAYNSTIEEAGLPVINTPEWIPDELKILWRERLDVIFNTDQPILLQLGKESGYCINSALLELLKIDSHSAITAFYLTTGNMNEPVLAINNQQFRVREIPFIFNGKVIGSQLEIIGPYINSFWIEAEEGKNEQTETEKLVSDLRMKLDTSQKLLEATASLVNGFSYSLSLSIDDLQNLLDKEFHINLDSFTSRPFFAKSLNEFFEFLTIEEDRKRVLESIKNGLVEFIASEKRESGPLKVPFRVKDGTGNDKDMIHEIRFRFHNGSIQLFGSGYDITEQFDHGNFHINLLQMLSAITSSVAFEALDIAMDNIPEIFKKAGAFSIFFPNDDPNQRYKHYKRRNLENSQIKNFDDIDKTATQEASFSLMDRVIESNGPFLIDDYGPDTEGHLEFLRNQHQVRSYLGCPVKVDGAAVGVINISSNSFEAFNTGDVEKLRIISDIVGIAISKANQIEKLNLEVDSATKAADEAALVAINAATLAEARLEQQRILNNVLTVISSGNAHDLRGPLNALIIELYKLRNGHTKTIQEDPAILDYIVNMEYHIQRMILMISEITQGYKALTEIYKQSEVIDIKQQLEFVMNYARELPSTLAPAKAKTKVLAKGRVLETDEVKKKAEIERISVFFEVDFDGIAIDAKINTNKSAFIRILENLLSNAIKYSDPKKSAEIKVTARTDDEYLYVSVQDNGLGIPEDFRKSAFKEVARVEDTKEIEGTGFGLTIIKMMLDEMGGSIDYTSKFGGDDSGSNFFFQIPLKRKTEEPLAQVHEA